VSLGILHGKDRDRWRARTIGYAFQSFNLLAAFSALENVCLALDLGTTVPRAARRARARALLDELGLGSRMHHRPGELSTGEQQRVAVARALANAPEVLLADEPTASVDPETREVVLSRLLREVHISKKVLLVATHDHSLLTRFDRVVRLDKPGLTAATPC
jgi:putative ABC transport system ATP-binding protein